MADRNRPTALLVQPPIYDFALYDLFLAPYGLLRIAAALEAEGWRVDFIDALDVRDPESGARLGRAKRKPDGTGKFFRSPLPLPEQLRLPGEPEIRRRYARYGILPEVLERRIAASRPEIAFLATGMTYWYPGVREAAGMIRRHHPGIPVIAGGPYAALLPDHCRSVCGVEPAPAGFGFGDLNRILATAKLPTLTGSAEELPAPAYNRRYWRGAGVLRLNFGCPCACDYCASKALSPRFRAGSTEELRDQFDRLWSEGLRSFGFYDDALLIGKERAFLPFLEGIVRSERRPRFATPNAVHLRQIDRECAGLMRRAGFAEVRLGFESSSETFHADHGRKYAPGSFQRGVELLKEAGFGPSEIGVYILTGLPGQSLAEVEDSVSAATAAGVRTFLAEYSPVPQSPLWDRCVARSRLPLAEEPLFHNNSFFPMARKGFGHAELAALKVRVREANRTLAAD